MPALECPPTWAGERGLQVKLQADQMDDEARTHSQQEVMALQEIVGKYKVTEADLLKLVRAWDRAAERACVCGCGYVGEVELCGGLTGHVWVGRALDADRLAPPLVSLSTRAVDERDGRREERSVSRDLKQRGSAAAQRLLDA
jgi:hypothetical protein